MTKVTPLPHRHGRIQVYFRRDKGWRIALPSTIGSDEFRAAYQAAITSQSVVKREQLSPAPSGRIAALVEAGCQKKGPGRAGPARASKCWGTISSERHCNHWLCLFGDFNPTAIWG